MRALFPFAFASILALALVPAAAGCDGDTTENPTGSGGSGASGGAGGAGGAGTGGSGGEGGGTTQGPLDPEAALRAAVLVGSCLPDDGINRWLEQFYTGRGGDEIDTLFREKLGCLEAKTNGCEGVTECLGVTVDLTGPCATSCDGNVYEACDDSLHFQHDCGAIGKTCSLEAGGCVTEPVGATCDYSTYVASCVDGTPRACLGVEASGPACASLGLTCGDTSFGDVGCIGNGPACDALTGSTVSVNFDEGIACDGENLRTCVNGFEHNLDCATLGQGFTCQTASFGAFCGLDAACEPGTGASLGCDGDSVMVCNGGRMDRIDCKLLGFTGCDTQLGLCVPSVYTSQP
ncbi:hypothetical protein [Chondromyces apiculatus]|uniref:Uncharacterized protein n=1 Tax=Chondromyces apiculatus DSM 436 TaxID=1192034 RepID=A0A017TH66_9BACT|nr:hypothetical protein [Chondromyces apiculatus]EYF08170.1 Hypothetical protein CAP_5930 [Chondromyces apiculatus DSM 436]